MKHTGNSVRTDRKNRPAFRIDTAFSLGLGIIFCMELFFAFRGASARNKQFDPGAYIVAHPCKATETDELCWKERIIEVMRDRGARDAFELVKFAYDSDAATAATCHSLTHEVGKLTYRLYLSGKKVSISPNISYCSYGFFHGFAEELFVRNKDTQQARDFCRYVDRELSEMTKDASLQCFHGIGHGIVDTHNPELWGNEKAIVATGLRLCDRVGETDAERSRCATGVFNGLAFLIVGNGMGLSVNVDDPLAICRTQTPIYEDACYSSMNIVLLTVSHMDLIAASAFINRIPSDVFARNAMINLVSPIGTQHMQASDHAPTVELCRDVPDRLHFACIMGYGFGLMEHGRPGREYEKALAFCRSNILTYVEQDACYSYILPYMKQWYSKDIQRKICTDVQTAFQQYCEL